jgi:transposase
MKRFVEGTDRSQSTLFPECLEDWINQDNPVRVIDVFVDELDLGELGFGRVDPEVTGPLHETRQAGLLYQRRTSPDQP